MNPIKFNDWSNLELKKDIERINKKLDYKEPVFLSICVEIVITIGAVLVDHFFDENTIPNYVWIIVSCIAIIPPIVILCYNFVKYLIRIIRTKNGNLKTYEFVDTFDNYICYWAMISLSFYDSLKNNNNLQNDEKMFYFQEANYYLYKSIIALDEMTPVAECVFSNDINESTGKHVVTLNRLETIVRVLLSVKKGLSSETNRINNYDFSKEQQKNLSLYYDGLMTNFLTKINDSFFCNLKWESTGQ